MLAPTVLPDVRSAFRHGSIGRRRSGASTITGRRPVRIAMAVRPNRLSVLRERIAPGRQRWRRRRRAADRLLRSVSRLPENLQRPRGRTGAARRLDLIAPRSRRSRSWTEAHGDLALPLGAGPARRASDIQGGVRRSGVRFKQHDRQFPLRSVTSSQFPDAAPFGTAVTRAARSVLSNRPPGECEP